MKIKSDGYYNKSHRHDDPNETNEKKRKKRKEECLGFQGRDF